MNERSEHTRWRDDLSAYLLGALGSDERESVEHHLQGCERCRDELRWLQPAVEMLPESVAQLDSPPQLRERLLAEVGRDAASPTPAATVTERPPRRSGGWRRFMLRPAVGLAGVALLAAAGAGYALHADSDSGPGTITTARKGPGGLEARLERSGDSGTLQLTGLHQAPSSHVYETWIQRGTKIQPSALFDARHNGSASIALSQRLEGADTVMVTVEPRGGSRQPTSPPVIAVGLNG